LFGGCRARAGPLVEMTEKAIGAELLRNNKHYGFANLQLTTINEHYLKSQIRRFADDYCHEKQGRSTGA